MGMLKDQVAMVTGGAQGIGAKIAERLAAEGAKVVVLDVNLEKAQAMSQTLVEQGTESAAFKLDVSNLDDVTKVTGDIIKQFDRVDILVNNAGVTRDGLLIRMSEQDWDTVLGINLKGTFNCCKAVTRQMMKQKKGAIINISSVVGLMGNAGQVNYSASKAGVIGLTKTLAQELASRGIRVNAVAPGFIQTAMTDALGDAARESLMERIPAKRLGVPEDVANAVFFLASELSSYVTGEVIRIDGGMAM